MEKAILWTLAYADIFDYPLKKDEILLWLVEKKAKNQKQFDRSLEKLLKTGHCQKKASFYFLPKRGKIVELRKKREKASRPKVKKARDITLTLRLIPWIKLIGVTGGLARKNSDEKDDIDLFFITSRKRLWLTRGLIVLVLNLLGVYRRPKRIKDMICPNMLISEEALKIKPQDLFTAHEVAMMKPIFSRDRTYQKFLEANSWAREFLPNSTKWRMENGEWRKRKKKIINYQLSIINSVERLAKRAQLAYMRKKRTAEVVSDTLIKFHPEDARGWVLKEYKKRLRKLQIN